jgi:sialate O-acetylesterase
MSHSVELPSYYETEADKSIVSDWTCPEFKVSGAFSSHMVVQREARIKVWGFSQSVGSTVTGNFMRETVTAKVDENNRFMLVFAEKAYTDEPQVMTIKDDLGHEVVFEDVLVGDVWFICGQSNAELHLAPCMELTPNLDFSENDNFRLFYQAQGIAKQNLNHIADPSPDVIRADWTWKRPDEKSSRSFSALGWYFAKEVTKMVGVPQGLIMMAAGGATLRELMPAELNHKLGYFSGANSREGAYFDTLINPFIPMSIKGMIFFQGESEGCWKRVADNFDTDMKAYFEYLREAFGRSFPV